MKTEMNQDWFRRRHSTDNVEEPKMIAAHSALLREFTDLGFDERAEMHWQESRPTEGDNMDVRPATETDLHRDLIEASGNL